MLPGLFTDLQKLPSLLRIISGKNHEDGDTDDE